MIIVAPACAQILWPSGPNGLKANDYFGESVSISASGNNALAGAFGDKSGTGAAWYYNGLNNAEDVSAIQPVKLVASGGSNFSRYKSLSLSGDSALVGNTNPASTIFGAAWYYKALNEAGAEAPDGVVTETLKLLPSDGKAGDLFGFATSLSNDGYNDNALVGAYTRAIGEESQVGAAYYYKALNLVDAPAGSVVTETIRLRASDRAQGDSFGNAVSLSNDGAHDNALVGANGQYLNGTANVGAVYYYKALDLVPANVPPDASPEISETLKLVASDPDRTGNTDYFGKSVSLSNDGVNDNALVGANTGEGRTTDTSGTRGIDASGAAYYFKALDKVSTTGLPVTEDVKLFASDGESGDQFGYTVSLSNDGENDNALIGASSTDTDITGKTVTTIGAAYYYKALDKVASGSKPDDYTGTVKTATYETVKLLASDGDANNLFGMSVSLDGARFIIGAYYSTHDALSHAGKVYTGDIRTFTTLDAGSTVLATNGLGFVSRTDWIIGENTGNNQVTLSEVWSSNSTTPDGAFFKDTANVTLEGTAVYIGKNAGADNNRLIIEGTLVAGEVYVGAKEGGNIGNAVRFTAGALDTLEVGTIYLVAGNFLEFEGDALDVGDVIALLSGATLKVGKEDDWIAVTESNIATFIIKTDVLAGDHYVQFSTLYAGAAVPEPAAWATLAGGVVVLSAWATRRRHRRNRRNC
ncbi:MAG: FG-GAP repeat protein [Opitutaceae bacterium]|jgi:hypothetical protein|nr:FG-GAP repeat protein [Opitutaceae bacterium]